MLGDAPIPAAHLHKQTSDWVAEQLVTKQKSYNSHSELWPLLASKHQNSFAAQLVLSEKKMQNSHSQLSLAILFREVSKVLVTNLLGMIEFNIALIFIDIFYSGLIITEYFDYS